MQQGHTRSGIVWTQDRPIYFRSRAIGQFFRATIFLKSFFSDFFYMFLFGALFCTIASRIFFPTSHPPNPSRSAEAQDIRKTEAVFRFLTTKVNRLSSDLKATLDYT